MKVGVSSICEYQNNQQQCQLCRVREGECCEGQQSIKRGWASPGQAWHHYCIPTQWLHLQVSTRLQQVEPPKRPMGTGNESLVSLVGKEKAEVLVVLVCGEAGADANADLTLCQWCGRKVQRLI